MISETQNKLAMGTIIPLGDGSVGKSVILQLLIRKDLSIEERMKILNDAKKSKNIEMEFAAEHPEDNDISTVSLQYYNFPGQIQKESARTITFDEILNIFEFLPALKTAHVILLMYDTNRVYTLKSLENWVRIAIKKAWISEETLLLLISNKIDLQTPNDAFVEEVRQGIVSFIQQNGIQVGDHQVKSQYTSCKDGKGVDEVRQAIVNWVAENGVKKA